MTRVLLASAVAVCVIYSGLLVWSFFGNRALEQEPLAAREISGHGIDSLQKLETVRQSLAKLTAYEHDGAPLRLRFGLYKGSEILPDVQKIYYARFRQLLFQSIQTRMLASLEHLPAAPGPQDDYRPAYDTLKSYLLTTSEWKRSSDAGLQGLLASKLDALWVDATAREIGQDRLNLAKRQFDFYASELHNGNPYPALADEGAVSRARAYLSQLPAPPLW
jgi:type VI secretion system protein ImpL